ncbi:MAG: hypothetical protein OQJ97_15215 [Rhodospirillales bacterium]|nr:hypothetical protein [Rhodospirillales bacterium]
MVDHIQIGDVSPRVQYITDGSQNIFQYPFPIFKNEDLEVYFGEALQTSGFTLSGAGNSAGGTVTFDTPPADGLTVTLRRYIAIQRTADFQEGGDILANTLNDELDYQTASLQQVSDDLDRTLRLSSTAPADVDTTLPAAEPGRVLIWDNDGKALINVDSTGFSGIAGPAGSDGVFNGTETTVAIAPTDKIAVLDASDSNNPKFVTYESTRIEASKSLGTLSANTILQCVDGLQQHGTLGASITLTAPDDIGEGYIDLLLTNDATGGYTLTLSGFTEISGTADMAANKVNEFIIRKHVGYTTLEVVNVA